VAGDANGVSFFESLNEQLAVLFSGSQPGITHLACQGRNLIALDEEISARRGRKGGLKKGG